MNLSLTMLCFEKKSFLKYWLRSLVPPRNTGFYTWTLKISVFTLFVCIKFSFKVLFPSEYPKLKHQTLDTNNIRSVIKMKTIKNELLFRNLIHCYNEQASFIITNYNLQHFYNKMMIQIWTFMSQRKIKIKMKLKFPTTCDSPCHFSNCIYLNVIQFMISEF